LLTLNKDNNLYIKKLRKTIDKILKLYILQFLII
jgi:hypothetical protein